MKKTIKGLMAIAIIGFTAGCDMGKDKTDALVTTDTSSSTNVTDNMVATTTPMDSNVVMMNADSTATAKPNPAKKGMKGTVSTALPAKKAGGNMEEKDSDGYYSNVSPAYPGGDRSLANFFRNNIEYPQDASDNGVEGTVSISFLVDETGKITSPMTNSPRLGYGLEEEAMRVFNKMPQWTPGSLKGKNVKTRYTLPVTFQLQ
ncbi:MAG: TonB family protein [Chitinophagaceae bacterium]|nr:MAG: TonB family protein [Chitinophagaceae bacterium]